VFNQCNSDRLWNLQAPRTTSAKLQKKKKKKYYFKAMRNLIIRT